MTRRFVRRTTIALALSATAFAPIAARAQDAPADTLPTYHLEGVTVTVTRTAVPLAALPQRVDVVTATDLARTPATDVVGALKKTAAVDVVEFPGLLAGVGVRGFRPQYSGLGQRTLLLVDGRAAGVTNLALLDLAGVERIEVLKGPGSALYGSNAMGGVVNIVPRRSTGALGATLSLGYGSWQTREARLSAGGALGGGLDFDVDLSVFDRGADYRTGRHDWLGDATARRGDGTDADTARGAVRPFTRYETQRGSARLGWAFADTWRVDVRAERFVADRVENPGDLYYAWGDGRSLKDVARTSAEAALRGTAGRHALQARLFDALEDQEYFNAPEAADGQPLFVNYRTPTRWRGLQLQDVIGLGAHALTLGADYTRARATSERFAAPGERTVPYSPDSETTSRALFAEARFGLRDERLTATLGGRFDRIDFAVLETALLEGYTPNREEYTVFNPSAGLNYRFASGLRAHASAGRAFVAPDAFQVAGRSVQRQGAARVALTRGNPDLDPESSVTWDAGLAATRGALDADVTFFDTRVRDRITSRRTLPGGVELTADGDTIESVTTYVNADAARMRGVEWRLGYDFGAATGRGFSLRGFANATHLLRAEETTAGATSDIRNVADLSLAYGVEYDDLRRFHTRLSGRYVGARSDLDYADWTNPAEVRYPRFMTLDWTGELRLGDRYRLGVAISNLTDQSYYEIRGYPLPGRAVQARLAVDF